MSNDFHNTLTINQSKKKQITYICQMYNWIVITIFHPGNPDCS